MLHEATPCPSGERECLCTPRCRRAHTAAKASWQHVLCAAESTVRGLLLHTLPWAVQRAEQERKKKKQLHPSMPFGSATRHHCQATAALLSKMCMLCGQVLLKSTVSAHRACTTKRDRARPRRRGLGRRLQVPHCQTAHAARATLTHLAMVACGIQESPQLVRERDHGRERIVHWDQLPSCRHKHHHDAFPMQALRQARRDLSTGVLQPRFIEPRDSDSAVICLRHRRERDHSQPLPQSNDFFKLDQGAVTDSVACPV